MATTQRIEVEAGESAKGPAYSRGFLIAQWAISAVSSLVVGVALVLGGSPANTARGISISTGELLLCLGPAVCAAIALYCLGCLLLRGGRQDPISRALTASRIGARHLRQLGAATLLLSLVLLSVPSYAFGDLAGYHVRLIPLAAFGVLLGLQAVMVGSISRWADLFDALREFFRSRRETTGKAAWFFAAFIVIWIIVALTRIGISGSEDYWYEAGVPVLPAQVALALLIGLAFGRAEGRLGSVLGARLDTAVFAGIWILAGVLWAAAPVSGSYFNPRPKPPNVDMFPYSDAATYDLQSQSALLGYGLNFGQPVDNPGYPALLVLIHRLTGQDYEANMALQATLLAALPALAYLVATSLFNRTAGMATGVLIALRGLNSIGGASFLNLAGPKQMLTDFPAALGVALVLLTLVWRDKSVILEPPRAIWHGAAVGFAFLIRSTALVLLLLLPVMILLRRPPLARGLTTVLAALLGFVLIVAPWGARNGTVASEGIIHIYLSKAQQVWTTRLGFDRQRSPDPTPKPRDTTPNEKPASEKTGSHGDGSKQEEDGPIALYVTGHFVHNLIGSALSLPTSFELNDLWHAVKATDTVWLPRWSGELGIGRSLGLLGALALLALGMAAVRNRRGLIGLAPLYAFLIYFAANSIGRTSGGRYLVPVDWILLPYFVVGIMVLLGRLPRSTPADEDSAAVSGQPGARAWIMASLAAVALGAAPLLAEAPFVIPSGTAQSPGSLSDTREIAVTLEQVGYSSGEITQFLEVQKGITISGQVLYPKFFGYRALREEAEGATVGVPFPHLEFVLVGPEAPMPVTLYSQEPILVPNATAALVIGCRHRTPTFVDAIIVVEMAQDRSVHVREGMPALGCPLPEPVCDLNGNCE